MNARVWLRVWMFPVGRLHLPTVALTGTFVELAGLCNVPEAEFGPLSDRWSFPVDVVTGQDGVQEDAPETGETWRSARPAVTDTC